MTENFEFFFHWPPNHLNWAAYFRYHEFTILVEPPMLIISIYLICLNYAQDKCKCFFKNNSSIFYFFHPKICHLCISFCDYGIVHGQQVHKIDRTFL